MTTSGIINETPLYLINLYEIPRSLNGEPLRLSRTNLFLKIIVKIDFYESHNPSAIIIVLIQKQAGAELCQAQHSLS